MRDLLTRLVSMAGLLALSGAALAADFDNAIDLLRNEKPMYLLYNGSGGGFENGIKTTPEPVGEAEK